jgi:hypothetical protein
VITAALLLWSTLLAAQQTATVTKGVNLRSDPSTSQSPIAHLDPDELLTLLSDTPESGYYHVKTSAGDEGWVWGRNIQVNPSAAPPTDTSTSIQPTAGVPGSAATIGCGDGLWQHVYHPSRLLVKQDCITVTGVIVDATAHQKKHRADGVRHEPDGDTHGWLKVDPQFANLLNAGNDSDEDGNLVFELVCHYTVTQTDAKPACSSFSDSTVIPPIGTHVSIKGTFVQETNHAKWNEIHPVSSITAQ